MLATRLSEVRNKQFLTQAGLSYLAGIPQETISKLEKGRNARASTIKKLAQALGVEPADLVSE